MRKSLVRRSALIVAVVGVVTASALAIPMANADEAPLVGSAGAGGLGQASAGVTEGIVTTLAGEMNATTAGAYRDGSSGQVVVNVTDEATAQTVRRSGATARKVRHSGATLRATEAALNRTANLPGTSWVIDPVTNQVVVSADSSVTGARLAKLRSAVARLGGTVRMEQVAGTFGTTITGGDAIFSGRSRCSLGFNVKKANGQAFFLTAGHCVRGSSQWFADGGRRQVLGNVVSGSFPGDDYGLVQYTSKIVRPGAFRLANGQSRDISRAGNAFVGQRVERSGSTTGVHNGQVTGLNATVNYSDGQVTGLIRTTVCAEPGDSGGALVSGNTALGLTSGGSGDCTRGGVTFFQPVTEALQVFSVQVY